MPPPKRQKVIGAFILLIFVMIITNLILLAVYASWNLEEEYKNRNNLEKEYTSIRFMRQRNGKIYLLSPKGLNENEVILVVQKIQNEIIKRKATNKNIIHGIIRLERRLKRALEKPILQIPFQDIDPMRIWEKVKNWPNDNNYNNLGEILRYTNKAKILQALNSKRGTQLKIELMLDGGQLAIFKPKWYSNDVIIYDDVYGGKDRHYGEISSFYLNQLLGYNSAPITVGRKINLKNEILPYTTNELKNTFIHNGSNLCFYGICYYCKREDPVCAQGNEIEGALILIMNLKFKTYPNPWRRSYKKNIFTSWENNNKYCEYILKDVPFRDEFILDIVAVSIFDFLIGNGDRHHLELYTPENPTGHSKSILLIDNGKSFGNPYEDYIDILAPLFQCCKIRSSLYSTLIKFKGKLGKSLDTITSYDPLYPLLTSEHLNALDERLEIIYATIDVCLQSHTIQEVII